MVRPLDETISSGGGGIAENLGMDRRIDAVQAARDHGPAALMTAVAISPSRGSGADEPRAAVTANATKSFLPLGTLAVLSGIGAKIAAAFLLLQTAV
jgi:hypothetical protein